MSKAAPNPDLARNIIPFPLEEPDPTSEPAAAAQAPSEPEAPVAPPVGPWPQWASREPVFSIGQVMGQLGTEFPALSISKLRYLEDQGLVTPARTGSGYRKYSAADVERVRFVLTEQRDAFLPLRVIRAKLQGMDQTGLVDESVLHEAPWRAADGGEGEQPQPAAHVGLKELATLTGAEPAFIAEVAAAAGVELDAGATAHAALLQAVESVMQLTKYGLDLRHLRAVFQAARRHCDEIEAAASALRGRGSAGRERAGQIAADMAESMGALYQSVVRLTLARRGF
jgi:DNA-binding transcriptional MerR regulator